MKLIIIPAVISRTQEELDTILKKIGSSADLLQLDIMDGKFVPSTSLNFNFEIPQDRFSYEAHLMISDPETWIEKFGQKVKTIIVHLETVDNPGRFIQKIKKMGKKAALALNPETPQEALRAYVNEIDQVLIMTVHPGFYGSKFLPEMAEKIKSLRELAPELDIEVDGGINPETIELVHSAGANMFVSGSYLIKAQNLKKNMEILKNKIS
ncbi:MAG: ribulose-phosphate 3-epimerase [Candidatus Aminicenantales bacterium]